MKYDRKFATSQREIRAVREHLEKWDRKEKKKRSHPEDSLAGSHLKGRATRIT